MRHPRLILCLALSLALATPDAGAQDSKRGRLPDGRAFRTDQEGNEIVDYIAELEMNNEALNRQVQGLESEVEEKNRQLTRLQGGEAASPVMGEKDLLRAPTSSRDRQSGQCGAQLSELQAKVRTLNETLHSEREQHSRSLEEYAESLDRQRSGQASCEPQVARARSEAERLQGELASLKSRQSSELEERSEKIESLESELERAREESEKARREVSSLQKEREQLVQARERVEQDLASTNAQLQRASSQPALRPPSGDTAPQPSAARGSATLAQARDRAVDSLRGGVRAELTQLNRLIRERDTLFSQSKQTGPLRVKPSALTSKRGLDVKSIEERIGQSRSVYEVTALKRDINEIRSKVADDVAVLKRMQERR